jgi:N-acetylneuraminate lyase
MNQDFDFVAAAHTTFNSDGELVLSGVAKQAEHLRSVGVSGVLVAGSTGEGSSLTTLERRQLAERWVEVGGQLEVMIQVGHDSLKEAAELARHAAQIGADAICAAPPNWFNISDTGLLAGTCAEIAAGGPELPFYYYHIPVLSGVHVKMRGLLDLVRDSIPNFAGIKFSHDDIEDLEDCLRGHGDKMRMLWGCDEKILTGLAGGAHGAVGSTYNFAMPLFHKLMAAHAEGDLETAKVWQARVLQLVETLASRGYSPCAKLLMGMLGIECGPARLPLEQLGPDAPAALRAELEALGFFDWIAG